MNFKEFRIGDLFDIHPTKTYKMNNAELFKTKGNTPVLSNSSVNNGIAGYCGLNPTEQGNIITFSDTTSGPDTMFYQPNPFIGYSHVQGMYPRQPEQWDEKTFLYFIAVARRSSGDFWNYSFKFNRKIVAELKVQLPITQAGEIDWQFMHERISELMHERISALDAYLKATGLNDWELTDEDKNILAEEKIFKEFRIDNLFDWKNGNTDIKKEHINCKGLPVVSSGVENMGVIGYTDIEARILPSNTITVDMFGNVFFRDFEYKEVTHARVFTLIPKNFSLTVETGLYFVTSLKWLPEIFSYSNMCSFAKIKDFKITLPVNSVGEIDFEYMEKYIRAIEKKVIAGVVKYKDAVIEATKKIVEE